MKSNDEIIEELAVEYFDLPFPSSEDSIVLSIKNAKDFCKIVIEKLHPLQNRK